MTTAFHINSFFNRHAADGFSSVVSADGIHAFLCESFVTPFPFKSLLVSVQHTLRPGAVLLLEAQVRVRNVWSGFYKLGMFSADFKRSFPAQEDSFGTVATDELQLFSAADAYRVRIHYKGDATLQGVGVCGVREPFLYDEKVASRLPQGTHQVAVEPISQMEQTHPDRRRICSPTSLCMALNALGISVSLEEVMRGVFDQTANIYGNWIFNTAYANEMGAEACIRRFSSLEQLKDFVTENSYVLASIAFEENELPGAPLSHTSGHFVVVRGWENHQILVADPAAPTAQTVCRAYGREEFARAWLKRKQGISYIVRKK